MQWQKCRKTQLKWLGFRVSMLCSCAAFPADTTSRTLSVPLIDGLGHNDCEAYMSWRVCSTPGCPNLIETPARKCDACARAQRDRARTRGHNPYGTKGHQSFRRQVLARDPYCTCPGDSGRGGCGKHHGLCGNPSTIADHYPYERTELIDMQLNPNDPKFGRGLCKQCHDVKTGKTRPAGFNTRQ